MMMPPLLPDEGVTRLHTTFKTVDHTCLVAGRTDPLLIPPMLLRHMCSVLAAGHPAAKWRV